MFKTGILRAELKIGVVSSISANIVKINLIRASELSASYIDGSRYGCGEVGEIVLIESQQEVVLGRLIEVRLPEKERNEVSYNTQAKPNILPIGIVMLLGTVSFASLKVQSGVDSYPRLGDRVFSAPNEFVAAIPQLIAEDSHDRDYLLQLGEVTGNMGCNVSVSPEELFGRHCAILGATGGGKSWTTAKIIEECSKFPNSKVILVDPTSEYRSLSTDTTKHVHLGEPVNKVEGSQEFRIPPTDFDESDFVAMFDPSGKVQGPKLREAIKSLRLAQLAQDIFPDGYVPKINQSKDDYRTAMNRGNNASLVDKPSQPFNVYQLTRQIVHECCWDNGDNWGNQNNDLNYCSSLLTRIQAVTHSPSLRAVFNENGGLESLDSIINEFLSSDSRTLRICTSDVSYEFYAREIIANTIGRKLLNRARSEEFRSRPLLVILDEAHNFLGKRVGADENAIKLNAFELIAKEGRKYGLNICIATQRPRDITEGVLSQMGTLFVHRLTNDKDRDVVERACGEIDKTAASFLPNLKQGEVAIVGVSFPIPMTVKISRPKIPPISDGPKFNKLWTGNG